MNAKRLVFGVLLIVGFSNISVAQFESLFGSESTQWNITMGNLWGSATAFHTVSGDTIIGGHAYKIIDGYGDPDFLGYLREDTSLGKAWYRNNQSPSESLIMDLNLNVGDSMYIGGNWNSWRGYHFVDSVYIMNNLKHIRFDFQLRDTKFTIIEGLSSNLGFRYQDNDFGNNFGSKLLCSYKNEIKVYESGRCTVSGLVEASLENIDLYPNPFKNNFALRLTGLEGKITNFDLISSKGEILKTGEIVNSILQITNLEYYKSGIYFILLKDRYGKVVTSRKVIKSR